MTQQPSANNDVVYVPVSRSLLAAAAPEWVSETTCEAVFGLDAARFIRACKARKIEGARKDGQLWLAPVASVRSYLRGLPSPGRRKAKGEAEEFGPDDMPARMKRA